MTPEIELPATLPVHYHAAARSAIDLIFDLPVTIRAVTLSGSIVRGEGQPLSDLDIWVVIDGDRRQRICRLLDGVPCEIFLNPEDRILTYFEEEPATGACSSVGLTLDGHVLHDPDGVAARLRERAGAVRDAGPTVDHERLRLDRYHAVDSLDNARDMHPADPITAGFFLADALQRALKVAYLDAGRWIPRTKDLRARIGEVRPDLVPLLDAHAADPTPETAAAVVEAVVGQSTFFDWDSEPDTG